MSDRVTEIRLTINNNISSKTMIVDMEFASKCRQDAWKYKQFLVRLYKKHVNHETWQETKTFPYNVPTLELVLNVVVASNLAAPSILVSAIAKSIIVFQNDNSSCSVRYNKWAENKCMIVGLKRKTQLKTYHHHWVQNLSVFRKYTLHLQLSKLHLHLQLLPFKYHNESK